MKGTRAKKEHIGYRGKQKVQLLPEEKVKCMREKIKFEWENKGSRRKFNRHKR